MIYLADAVALDGVRKTNDGYLVAVAKTARTGIQLYTGREVDPDNAHGLRDQAVVRVYRPPEEVFNRDTMASMAHRPVTLHHPPRMVDSKNWKDHAGGITDSDVLRDGEFVRVPLTLMDQGLIDAYERGTKELSWGYGCEIVFQDGTTPTGEAFDVSQRGIRANHLAVCDQARGGADLRIGDETPTPRGAPPMTDRIVAVDGIPYTMSDQVAGLVGRLQGLLTSASTALTDAAAQHATEIAAKDTALGKAAADVIAANAKIVDGAALDALVAARAGVVTKAKAAGLTDAQIAGKTNAEIVRAAVSAKLGDAAVKDKPDAYVEALFDHLGTGAAAGADPVRAALSGGLQSSVVDASASNTAHQAMVDEMTKAWQAPAGNA